jgi:hypothetical protein
MKLFELADKSNSSPLGNLKLNLEICGLTKYAPELFFWYSSMEVQEVGITNIAVYSSVGLFPPPQKAALATEIDNKIKFLQFLVLYGY